MVRQSDLEISTGSRGGPAHSLPLPHSHPTHSLSISRLLSLFLCTDSLHCIAIESVSQYLASSTAASLNISPSLCSISLTPTLSRSASPHLSHSPPSPEAFIHQITVHRHCIHSLPLAHCLSLSPSETFSLTLCLSLVGRTHLVDLLALTLSLSTDTARPRYLVQSLSLHCSNCLQSISLHLRTTRESGTLDRPSVSLSHSKSNSRGNFSLSHSISLSPQKFPRPSLNWLLFSLAALVALSISLSVSRYDFPSNGVVDTGSLSPSTKKGDSRRHTKRERPRDHAEMLTDTLTISLCNRSDSVPLHELLEISRLTGSSNLRAGTPCVSVHQIAIP